MAKTNDHVDITSLERIVPDELHPDQATGSGTLRLHTDRYQFAKHHLVQGSVLDLACGVGYGTALLSEGPRVTRALGVDISTAAVNYAVQRYGGERVLYA